MPEAAALIAVPLPFNTPVIVVDKVSAGVVPPELLPAKPLALATETAVTVPVVGVDQVGVPAVALVKTCPVVPAAVYASAVPVPYTTAPAVGVAVLFVPPLAIGKVPVTSLTKLTALKAGLPAALPCSSVVVVPWLVMLMLGAAPPLDTIGVVAVTVVIPPRVAISAGGGPIWSSSNVVGLDPLPVKINRFWKNRYHSLDINPVRSSSNATRGAGMLVMLAIRHSWA